MTPRKIKWLIKQDYRTGYKAKQSQEKLDLYETCLHVETYDGLPLNSAISLHIDLLYNQPVCLQKLLARQSCADSWRQHIKGLCGSAVSSNGLSRSFLPSGFSSQGHIITAELPATKHRGQTFKGNGIGSKQRYYCYSQHQSQSAHCFFLLIYCTALYFL